MIRHVVAATAVALIALPAAAVTSLSFAAPGTQSVQFNGFTEKGAPLDGLAGRLDLTLVSVDGGKAQFDYALVNLSGGAIDTARISLFGFDVAGLKSATASGDFAGVGAGNVPMLGFADVCFSAGKGGNCAGGGGAGIWGGEAATGSFTLNYADTGLPLVLDNLFVRYQSIASTEFGIKGGSGIGVGTVWQDGGGIGGAVPEPATWGLMIAGFGLVGASLRRRKSAMQRVMN